jgi:RNA-binding protein
VTVSQGLAILRTGGREHAAIGASVVDDSLDVVGRVVDVFGPVDDPFVAVTPDEGVHLPGLVGTRLYLR